METSRFAGERELLVTKFHSLAGKPGSYVFRRRQRTPPSNLPSRTSRLPLHFPPVPTFPPHYFVPVSVSICNPLTWLSHHLHPKTKRSPSVILAATPFSAIQPATRVRFPPRMRGRTVCHEIPPTNCSCI